jgi:hypothetical protein
MCPCCWQETEVIKSTRTSSQSSRTALRVAKDPDISLTFKEEAYKCSETLMMLHRIIQHSGKDHVPAAEYVPVEHSVQLEDPTKNAVGKVLIAIEKLLFKLRSQSKDQGFMITLVTGHILLHALSLLLSGERVITNLRVCPTLT